MFEVRVDDRELKQLERTVKSLGGNMGTVMSRSLNKTATSARVQVGRELSRRTGITAGLVKKRVPITRATRRNWAAMLRVSRKRLPLSVLGPKGLKRGGLSVKSAGKRVVVSRAFSVLGGWFIRQPQGKTVSGVVEAASAADWRDRALTARLPISRIKGPILAEHYRDAEAEVSRIYRDSQQKLAQNIHNQVKLIIQRRRAIA